MNAPASHRRVPGRIVRAAHRRLTRVAALDVTRVLVRRAGTGDAVRRAHRAQPAITCREVGADELRDASADLVDGMTSGRLRCFAAFDDASVLIGHDFIATDTVPPRWNSGGARFRGIGIELPPGCAYVFKAWVARGWRGRGVHGALLRSATMTLDAEGCPAAVTTASWTNTASLAGFARAGFERRGVAVEAVIGGRSAFRVPPPVALASGERVRLLRGGR